MRLFWTPAARRDRREIVRYVSTDDARAALKLDETFQRRAELLLEHPDMGRPGRLPGTREVVVHPRYLLVYSVYTGEVRILRTVHTSRLWPPSDD